MDLTIMMRRLAVAVLRNPNSDQYPRILSCSAQLTDHSTVEVLSEWLRLGWMCETRKGSRIFRLTPTGRHELELLLR